MKTESFWNEDLRTLIFSGLILSIGVAVFHWSLGPVFFLLWIELVIQAIFLLVKLRWTARAQRSWLAIILVFFYTPLQTCLFLLVQRVSGGSLAYPLSVWVSSGLLLVSAIFQPKQAVTLPHLSQEVFGRLLALSLAGMVGYGIWQASNSVLWFVLLFTVTSIGFGFLLRCVQWRRGYSQ